jgi:FtsH-binding integral membrane protein
MLSLVQDAIILIVTLAASLLFMFLLNRVWSQEKRSVNNDLIGWQLTIVGTTYAVILGFMLLTVWNSYGESQANVDLEANALRDLYRTADALPEPQRTQLKQEARAYADAVIDRDWPEMADDKIPEGSHLVNEAMWKTVMTLKPDSQTAAIYTSHVLDQLTRLTEHRRTRMLQAIYKLPAIFWAVLIVGAVVTVLSAATFGARNTALHAFQVLSFTLLVTLVLLAISDVNLPFEGWVHIDNYSFVRARTYMTD